MVHRREGRYELKKVPGTQRAATLEATYDRVASSAFAYGVTRLADITGLDCVGIPVYCAIVPRSADIISVYAGKGLTALEAKVGALMEAIERQTALRARPELMRGTLEKLQNTHSVLDPTEVNDVLLPDYSPHREYDWLVGYDLVSDRDVLVPAGLAGYFWNNLLPGPFVSFSTTNGLASGNVLEEAICQGLCELIERDAWTLADIGAHLMPWVFRRALDPKGADAGPDDYELFQTIQVENDPTLSSFYRAGLKPILHDITSDIGIPTVFAAIVDEGFPSVPMVHGGLGSHPNACIALRRALTEAAQSRCVDIQGVREDLTAPASHRRAMTRHTERIARVNRRAWTLNESNAKRPLSDLPTASHEDIQDDLNYLIRNLQMIGIDRVIVVDFSPPDASFAVVRVIVPQLEKWALHHTKLGQRAQRYWQTHV